MRVATSTELLIIDALANGPMTPDELVYRIGRCYSSVRRALDAMRSLRIVRKGDTKVVHRSNMAEAQLWELHPRLALTFVFRQLAARADASSFSRRHH